MRLAVMQPYFLPYIGYWQLIAAVDKFVILDDVNYINRGWIARNRIACNGQPCWLTLPLQGASQNKLICELDIKHDDGWRSRMLKTIRQNYHKAPCFEPTFALFEGVLSDAQGNLSEYLAKSIAQVAKFMGVETEIIPTSRIFPKGNLKGSERIIDLCKRAGAAEYINPPGGRELYDPRDFHAAGIELSILCPQLVDLPLLSGVSDGTVLSILDMLMLNPRPTVLKHIMESRDLERV
jgi:hypothetical protein